MKIKTHEEKIYCIHCKYFNDTSDEYEQDIGNCKKKIRNIVDTPIRRIDEYIEIGNMNNQNKNNDCEYFKYKKEN